MVVGSENTKTFKQIAKGKFSEQYEIREVRSIRPSIRIVGFSDDIEEDNIVTYLRKQNEIIFGEDSDIKLLKVNATKKINKSIRLYLTLICLLTKGL